MVNREGKLFEFTDLFLTLTINNKSETLTKLHFYFSDIWTVCTVFFLFILLILFPVQLTYTAHEQKFILFLFCSINST